MKGNTTDLTSALGEVVRRNSTNEITKDDIQPIAAKLGMSTLIEWGLLVLVLAGIGLGFYLLNASQGEMTQANVALNGALKSLHEDFNQLKSAKSGAAPASSDETIQLVRQKMKDVDEKILKGADETRRRLDEMVKGFEEQAKQFQLQSRASRESLDGVVERFREQGEKKRRRPGRKTFRRVPRPGGEVRAGIVGRGRRPGKAPAQPGRRLQPFRHGLPRTHQQNQQLRRCFGRADTPNRGYE